MELVSIFIAFGALIVAIIFGIYSSKVAINSRDLANQAYQDSRSMSLLDLDPKIGLTSLLRKAGKTSPHFRISNDGPVDAVQLDVQLLQHKFDLPNLGSVSGFISDDRHQRDRLKPFESFTFEIPPHFLEKPTDPLTEPLNEVMEVHISYRRESDRKSYSRRAVYFIDPNQEWVSENDQSINSEKYVDFKAAALRPTYGPFVQHSDTLHDDGDDMN